MYIHYNFWGIPPCAKKVIFVSEFVISGKDPHFLLDIEHIRQQNKSEIEPTLCNQYPGNQEKICIPSSLRDFSDGR